MVVVSLTSRLVLLVDDSTHWALKRHGSDTDTTLHDHVARPRCTTMHVPEWRVWRRTRGVDAHGEQVLLFILYLMFDESTRTDPNSLRGQVDQQIQRYIGLKVRQWRR